MGLTDCAKNSAIDGFWDHNKMLYILKLAAHSVSHTYNTYSLPRLSKYLWSTQINKGWSSLKYYKVHFCTNNSVCKERKLNLYYYC